MNKKMYLIGISYDNKIKIESSEIEKITDKLIIAKNALSCKKRYDKSDLDKIKNYYDTHLLTLDLNNGLNIFKNEMKKEMDKSIKKYEDILESIDEKIAKCKEE